MSIINRSRIKALALESSRGRFTRVSKEFLDRVEATAKMFLSEQVRESVGVKESLVNQAEAKKYLVDKLHAIPVDALTVRLRAFVASEVHRAPSIGITLK